MGKFFVKIYDYFINHKLLMWLILFASTVLMTIASLQVDYVEDITNFFPKSKDNVSLIFKNLKSKDKIAIMFTSEEENPNINAMIACAEDFKQLLNQQPNFTENAKITLEINDSLIESMSIFIYNHLPAFLDDEIYDQLDSITSAESIAARMKQNYNNLISPIGGYISNYIYQDPLGLGGDVLKALQNQGNNFQYNIIDNYIFSSDQHTLMAYIDPSVNGNSLNSEKLIRTINTAVESIHLQHPKVKTEYFGAPAVAAYNARQIKRDSMITLTIAIVIILLFFSFAFKNKYTIFLILTPVFFGAVFALSIIYLINGEISLIAVGSGSIIFGIALSYSIHILSHTNHCNDMRQLIRELAYPLTVGSFTTIGAFFGLLFTNSNLLQDFGLFSALTLIGTTLFALIFLPHFIKVNKESKPNSRLFQAIEKLTSIHLDQNKPLVIGILLITLLCVVFFRNVKFDSNMMNLNFMPSHLEKAENRLNSFTQQDDNASNVMFIASSKNQEDAAHHYLQLCTLLDSLQENGSISSYSSVSTFIVPPSVQKIRLEKWNSFWTFQKRKEVLSALNTEADKMGFEEGTFTDFKNILNKKYQIVSYADTSRFCQLFPDWISTSDDLNSFIAQVKIDNIHKRPVYDEIIKHNGIIAVDRAFFAGKMAEDVNHNFYLILYISGLLIFLALLLSYGRIELALMSFLPMFVSWIIILGIMSLLGIQFNIVTIILSSFIFGIGDDFSIFVMDGLQSEYKDNTQVLSHHKSAIFFSAFTVIVGMGALVFAKHPAMNSLGIISLIGILVVVLVAYTVQPFIFRLLISRPAQKGDFPHTLFRIVLSFIVFVVFLLACLIIQIIILLMAVIPLKKATKKTFVGHLATNMVRLYLKLVIHKNSIINEHKETFEKPAIIIANHQSFLDILLMISMNHKFILITKGWVWNSPIFGYIVRYLDFYCITDGYDSLEHELADKVKEGYSIVIFPEGTRSANDKINRFHKGAFYLAEQLKLDIIPILMYGNGLIISKKQPLYYKKGNIASKILPRIPYDSTEFGNDYREKTKSIAHYFKEEYHLLYEDYNRADNPYFRNTIVNNYTYKGPVIEWYMRIKLRMEKWYDQYDRLLPRQGDIVDLGCGYGAMSYMLMMLSDQRHITGVDYDEDKIALAKHSFLKNNNIEFVAADVRQYQLPKADAFIISDVLHYFEQEAQEDLIVRCITNLKKNGIIVIRDGDASQKERHQNTEKTEKWSTEIMKFNKTDGPLCFLSKEQVFDIAEKNQMNIKIIESKSHTSNTLFVLTTRETHN